MPETCRDVLNKIATVSDIKLDTYTYYFMMHGTMNLKCQNVHQVHNTEVTNKSLKNIVFLLLSGGDRNKITRLNPGEIRNILGLESLIFLLLLSPYTN
jgi:hypothetical protein